MSHADNREVEIKLPLTDLDAIADRLRDLGATVSRPRLFESNRVLDTPEQTLRNRRELIRIRTVGDDCVLTYKGSGDTGRHKSREEIEVNASDAGQLQLIFERLGYRQSFRYDKYRTEYALGDGTITVDETPIGHFLELEGPPAWIDRTASSLGFGESSYITDSYADLYTKFTRERNLPFENMIFSPEQ